MEEHNSIHRWTWKQKINLLSGQDVWTLSPLERRTFRLSDGPHGVRRPLSDLTLQQAHPATCFPAGCALACSWNTSLVYRMGQALARECQHYDVQVLLGPAMNLKRHGRGGRNLEYFSEDPYLTGTLATAYVKGVQSLQVGACVKHFAVNNQESHRMVVGAVVDERTLRELYLRAFQIVVTGQPPAMVMGAYNRLNETYCCEHPHLHDILRREWGFDGVCVTDWGASHDRVAALQVGLDLEMPGNRNVFGRELLQAHQEGRLPMSTVDASVQRILRLRQRFQGSFPPTPEGLFERNHELAYEIAMDSVVLLQNENDLLPLQRDVRLAVIGEFAKDSRYQGMGSSHCTPTQVSHTYDAIFPYTDHVAYAPGYHANGMDNSIHPDLIEEAVQVSQQGDVVVMFLGLPEILESEGFDREDLQLPWQHVALLEALTAVHDKIVVVLSNGGVVELPDCVSNVSILEGYLLGQGGGRAIVDLIFGKASPSGRLAETMPLHGSSLPADAWFPGTRDRVEYREGLDVGYRYYDSQCSFQAHKNQNGEVEHRNPVRFPFGHGLTYSRFEYSNLRVARLRDQSDTKNVRVQFQLRNVGSVAAAEVPQCYVAPLEPSVYRPSHELKAFTKRLVQPNESIDIEWMLSQDAFSFYDIGHQAWIVEPGDYEIQIGASSQDIQLQTVVQFQMGQRSTDLARDSYPLRDEQRCSDESFAKRFGKDKEKILHDIQEASNSSSDSLDRTSLLKDAAAVSMLGSMLFHTVFWIGCKEIPSGPTRQREVRMVRANVENLPLRTIVLFSKGGLSLEFLDAFIASMNGQLWKAAKGYGYMVWCWLKGFVS